MDFTDIKTTRPEVYPDWLRSQGVPEAQIDLRIASDAMREVSFQFAEMFSPVLPGETLAEFEARFAEFQARSGESR